MTKTPLAIGEPEPETIKSSDDEGKSKHSTQFPKRHSQFSNSEKNYGQVIGQKSSNGLHITGVEEDIGEELDDEPDYADEFEEDAEEQSIQDMRREEMRKSVYEKDEKRLAEYLNQRRVSDLEYQLKNKDK